jgi:cation diffusion facilitator family transporter
VRFAAKPADEQHPFGHGKLEHISAAVEAGLLFFASVLIIYEATIRIAAGTRVELVELGIGVMGVSILVNALVSRHLLRVSRATDSIALEADARHLTADIYTSAGVLIGLVAVRLTGFHLLDPLLAMGVALLILKAAYSITRKSFLGLMDVKLPAAEEALIRQSIAEHFGELVGYHDLRTRKSGGERYIDLHLVMAKNVSLEEAHRMCDHLEEDIKTKLPRASITIHVEPCEEECGECSLSCPEEPPA